MKIFGIYKITSPSNKIYIGQSRDIINRKYRYKSGNVSRQRMLYASLKKYGWENHKFEIIHELPKDVSQEVLDSYEITYIKQYKDCGFKMMNLTDGGRGYVLSEETKKRISKAKIKYYNDNPDAINRASIAMKKRHKENENIRKNHSKFMKIYCSNPKELQRLSDIAKKQQLQPGVKEAHSKKMKEYFSNPVVLEKNRNQKTNKAVICLNTKDKFSSLSQASRVLNIPICNISNVCKGKRKSAGGLNFSFIC